jgi:hypothetical protein
MGVAPRPAARRPRAPGRGSASPPPGSTADRLGRLQCAGLAHPASGHAPVRGEDDTSADMRALWTAPLTQATFDGGPPFAHSPVGPPGNQRFALSPVGPPGNQRFNERHLALPIETHRVEAIPPRGQAHWSIGLETPWRRGHAAPKRGPVVDCFRTSSTASSASARPATIFDSAPEFGLTRRSSMPSATLPRRRS